MKLSDVRENYSYFSGKASDIVRQLGFAGIAVIWVFKTDTAGRPVVPTELLPPAILIAIGLALDFLHYICGSLIWAIYNGLKERAGTTEVTEFLAPRPINWPTITLFWLKILAMITAYSLLIRFLISRLYV